MVDADLNVSVGPSIVSQAHVLEGSVAGMRDLPASGGCEGRAKLGRDLVVDA